MINPILSMLNNNSTNGLSISMNDPRMNNAIDYVNSHGGNPQQAFYERNSILGMDVPGHDENVDVVDL